MVSDEIKAEHSCAGDRTELLHIHIALQSATFNCLHPQYNSPFCRLFFSKPEFVMSRRTDHMELHVRLPTGTLSDLTGYPATTPPADFVSSMQTCSRDLLTFFAPCDEAGAISVFIFNKDDCCPIMPRIVRNTRVMVSVRAKEVMCNFVLELMLSRQIPYLVNVLAGALMPPAPASPPQKEELKPVESSFAQIECRIQKISMTIKPRESYTSGYSLLAEELRVGNTRAESSEFPGVETSTMTVGFQKIVMACGHQQVVDPFDLEINIETSMVPDQFKAEQVQSTV